jgi:hypothetical protein
LSLNVRPTRVHSRAPSSSVTSQVKWLFRGVPEPAGDSTRAVTSNLGGCCPSSRTRDSTSVGSSEENFATVGPFRRADANPTHASKALFAVGPSLASQDWTIAATTTARSASVPQTKIDRSTAEGARLFVLPPRNRPPEPPEEMPMILDGVVLEPCKAQAPELPNKRTHVSLRRAIRRKCKAISLHRAFP